MWSGGKKNETFAGGLQSVVSAVTSPTPEARPVSSRLSIMELDSAESREEQVKKEVERATEGMKTVGYSTVTLTETFFYQIENTISTYPNAPFYFLLWVVVFCVIWQGAIWYYASRSAHPDDDGADDAVFGYGSLMDSVYFTIMTLVTGGYEDEIPDVNGLRWIYLLQSFTNIVLVAVLIGFMNDAISSFMSSLSEGRTKVAEEGHTLILGWSEATIRVVIQISFLRRQYQALNERRFWWLDIGANVRDGWIFKHLDFIGFAPLAPLKVFFKSIGLFEKASTPLASADIVLMNIAKSKDEMHEELGRAMEERDINPHRTKIGQNVICRVGDPTNVSDLQRVRAHRAAAIITMMTERDIEEFELSSGKIENGATLRTCLALRHVLFANNFDRRNLVHPDLRIVLQMTSPSVFVDAACFKGNQGDDKIIPMELTMFLNSLMFSCAAQPGLAKVILEILDFKGVAIRRRKVSNLRAGPGGHLGGAVGMTFKELQYEYTRAVFVGCIKATHEKEEMKRNGFGLCPNPNHRIEADDLLIFIGPKSSPDRDGHQVDVTKQYNEDAKAIVKQNREFAAKQKDVKDKKNVLVCGWRSVWSDVPERLRLRIMEIAHARIPGAWLIFVNGVRMDPQDESSLDEMDERQMSFKEIMDECGFRALSRTEMAQLPKVPYRRKVYEVTDRDKGGKAMGIYISHIHGDAADPEVLEDVVIKRTIHTAIVLGTQATARLPAHSRDTRVLSIMLLLRKLWMSKGDGIPMHVVGENQEDMTARLALGPQVEYAGDGTLKQNMHEPDFINTQAIYARVLVQTLAYPVIRHAVMDLFEEGEGSCELEIVRAGRYVTLHRQLVWGVVQQCVVEAFKETERSICIGYINDHGKCVVLPEHTEDRVYTEGDRLVILRRMFNEIPDYNTNRPSQRLDRPLSIEVTGSKAVEATRSKATSVSRASVVENASGGRVSAAQRAAGGADSDDDDPPSNKRFSMFGR